MTRALRVTRQAWLALSLLTLINLLNYLDRYILSAILPALKAEPLSLSDTQLGWLQTAFMLVYMLLAPVFGILGDRGSRTRPIAAGVAVWSLATVLSGFAGSYLQLLVTRALVGTGESAYAAIAPALLSDLFPAGRRGGVLAIFNMAIPVGSALGYIVGGLMSHAHGWRAAFFVAGLPGLLAAGLMLGLRDPPRGAQDGAVSAKRASSPLLADAMRVYGGLLQRVPYLLIVLGYAAYTFALGGLAFWMPAFLERVRGVPETEATTRFGLIVVAMGFAGTFLGGWLGDRLLRFSRQAYLWLSGIVTLLAVPCTWLALTVAQPALFYPALILAQLLLFMTTGPVNAAIVNAVSPLQRASAVALSMFLIHLLGDVPSPILIGRLSDVSSLGTAVLMVPVAVALAGVLWLAAARAGALAPAVTADAARP